jgi:hypothetical protein
MNTGESFALEGVTTSDLYDMAEKRVEAFVIGCGDPRFRRLFEKEIFKKTGIQYAYVWPNWVPGGVKRLLEASEQELNFTLEEIGIAVELAANAGIAFGDFVFVLANHAGTCAGYRGKDAGMVISEQVDFHRNELASAEKRIAAGYEARYGVQPKVFKILAVPETSTQARAYWID